MGGIYEEKLEQLKSFNLQERGKLFKWPLIGDVPGSPVAKGGDHAPDAGGRGAILLREIDPTCHN